MGGNKLYFNIENSFKALKYYCEEQQFKGWDPYDGLNSKVFNLLPLKKWDLARLAWIQAFKRSPINLRRIFLVPKEYNAKGIGLLLTAYCNLYHIAALGETKFGTKEEILSKINELSNLLIDLRTEGYSNSCWGYNFDWQARRLFLFPKNTPTVVATTFCATALMEAYEITQNEQYLQVAVSAGGFVLNDLSRTQVNGGYLFSYSPLNGNNTVYNASLLGSRLLSYCYKYTQDDKYAFSAKQSVIASIKGQELDGSWVYGLLPVQNWKDSFHTGYNLDGLIAFQNLVGDNTFQKNIKIGFNYYLDNFFEPDGMPKYYNDKTYPIDIHCPAQLMVTLSRLDCFKENRELATKVMNWTIQNMQHKSGYFFYQLKKTISSKISYMRWSNAFMFYAMSFYLYEEQKYINETSNS